MSKAFKKIFFVSVVSVIIMSSCRGHGPLCPAYSLNKKEKKQTETNSTAIIIVEKTS